MNRMIIATMILCFLIMSGCATPLPTINIIKHYDEAALSLKHVGVVMTRMHHRNGAIKITAISEGLGMDGVTPVHHPYVLLKPGQHSFNMDCTVKTSDQVVITQDAVFMFTGSSEIIGIPVSQTMDVKPGHLYFLTGNINKKENRWQASVSEIKAEALSESDHQSLIKRFNFVKTNYPKAETLNMHDR